MTNLKCHEYQCKNNMCSRCVKETLSISNDAYCNDYYRRDKNDEPNCDYEFAYEGPLSLKQDEHMIYCNKTTCLNNINGECSAGYIRIDRLFKGARCCQVREK